MPVLLPLEYLRRSEEVDDLDAAITRAIERNAPPAELKRLKARAVALLERLEKDLP